MSIWASLDGAPGTHRQVQLRDMDDDDVDTYKNTGPARLTLDVATTWHDGVRLSLWDAHDERLQGIVSGPDLDDLHRPPRPRPRPRLTPRRDQHEA